MQTLRYIASDQVRFHREVTYPARQIDFYRFLHVESGQGRFNISGNEFGVRAGWLGLLAPGLRECKYFDGEPVSFLYVEFASSRKLVDGCSLECRLNDPHRSTLLGLLRAIDGWRSDRDGCLLSAAHRLMFPVKENSTDVPSNGQLARVMEIVRQHPQRNPTVSELAAAIDVSEPHLRRLFRRHLRISPKQFLLRTRMEFAQRLLRIEGLRVGETANLLGFGTVHQFSAQYRRVIGRPPSDDRVLE